MCEESQEQNLNVALGVTPLTLGSRQRLRTAEEDYKEHYGKPKR
jgi:hypothetical protein